MFTNMPNFSHITKEDFEHIYEPAEDTFLLLDALEKDIHILQDLKSVKGKHVSKEGTKTDNPRHFYYYSLFTHDHG